MNRLFEIIRELTKTTPVQPVIPFVQGSARRGVKSIVHTNDLSGEKFKAAGQMALGREIASAQTTIYR